MDPQTPPSPAPAFAQYHNHNQHCPHEEAYNEKDAYARDSYAQRGSKSSNRSRAHDSVISSHPLSPRAQAAPSSPTGSIASAPGHRQQHSTTSEIQRSSVAIAAPPRAHLDPEKGNVSSRGAPSPSRVSASNAGVATAVLYDAGEYCEKGPEEKPLQLLFFLSFPCALLSFAITLWTIVALFLTLLLQPLRLFSTRPSLGTQLTNFLAPPLNLQLHLIYSLASSTTYSPAMLVIVHLFSPFVAIGVAIAAWTAAFFWFFSAILGDPAGQDGHNDGKESILGVRRWWERWLARALR